MLVILYLVISAANRIYGTTNIPETTNTAFSLIKENMTWNEASVECSLIGGRLVNIYDEVRKLALSAYTKYLKDSNMLGTSFWTGLHDIGTSGLFRWSDCSPITTSYWSNSTQAVGEYCVSANLTDLSWKIRPCTDHLPALCETPKQCNCSLDRDDTMCADMVRTSSTAVEGITEESCKITCLQHVRSNEQCWAVSYSRATSTCIVHERLQTTTFCTDVLIFYSKTCFTYITSGFLRKNNSYINDDVAPVTECTTDTVLEASVQCSYSLPENTSDSCKCPPCSPSDSGLPEFWANSTLEEQINWLVTTLQVNKHNTSIMRRRKISVADSRITATSIGYMGAAVLVFIVGGIIILDMSRLWKDISHIFKWIHFYKDR